MEGVAPTPARRELRLYQAEHLLRDYGFRFDELAFDRDGNLSLDDDPKTAWAHAHPELFPLEVTRAPREMLVRVPGIAPSPAARRRAGTCTLRFAGSAAARASTFPRACFSRARSPPGSVAPASCDCSSVDYACVDVTPCRRALS